MSPPDDYFTRFGLERRFDVDDQRLNARYEALMNQAKVSGGGGAAEIEEARRVLADPELRADYLLDLTGGPSSRELDTIWAEQRQTIDRLRQQWADATSRRDAAAKDAVRPAVAAERQARLERVAMLFRMLTGGDGPVVQRDRRRNIRMEVNALRALRGIEAAA